MSAKRAHPEHHAALWRKQGGMPDRLVGLAAQAVLGRMPAPERVDHRLVHPMKADGVRAGRAAVQHQGLRRPRDAGLNATSQETISGCLSRIHHKAELKLELKLKLKLTAGCHELTQAHTSRCH